MGGGYIRFIKLDKADTEKPEESRYFTPKFYTAMRKIKIFMGILTLGLLMAVASVKLYADESVEPPEFPDQPGIHCRCHNDGVCYGGNQISFRKLCHYSDTGSANCNDHSSNCPN
jgi:hypothetical protein